MTRKRCVIDGCEKFIRAKDYCEPHYVEFCEFKVCVFPGCAKALRARGYCYSHYAQLVRNGRVAQIRKGKAEDHQCIFPDCERSQRGRGYCKTHYENLLAGKKLKPIRQMGGGWTQNGYRMHKIGGRTIFDHRMVMEKALGRQLLPSETVHHINGNRSDNRLENLQLRQGRHGIGVVYACLDCGSANVQATPIANEEMGRDGLLRFHYAPPPVSTGTTSPPLTHSDPTPTTGPSCRYAENTTVSGTSA